MSYMTPRLLAIASMVQPGAHIIDVGTDHAYIPVYLVQNGIAACALATDIHEGPILRAQQNIVQADLQDTIKTMRADGLRGIALQGYDTVVIAGMGGILIAEIIDGARLCGTETLLLQPMTAIAELREYLLSHGFCICRERLAREDEKLYTVLEARRGEAPPYSDAELLLGRNTADDPLFSRLRAREIERMQKKLRGLLQAHVQDKKIIARCREILRQLEE